MAVFERRTDFAWPDGVRAGLSLTFDDARLSQVDAGLAVLDRHGVKCTFYVSPAGVEKRLDGWRSAVRAGHEIGNHTMTHPCSGNFSWSRGNALEDYTLERIAWDIAEADARIEALLDVRPSTFAYPCGQTFVGRGEEAAAYVPIVAQRFSAGRGAFSETHNDPSLCDLAQLAARDADGAEADRLLSMLDAALAAGGWLVLFAHDVAPSRQGLAAGALDAFLARATDPSRGLWIDTVAAIVGHLRRRRGEPVNPGGSPLRRPAEL